MGGEDLPGAGNTLELVFSTQLNLEPRPGREIHDSSRDKDLERAREVADAARDVDGDARDVGRPEFDLAGVQAGPERDTDFLSGVEHC